jgi:hypothetical protein
MIKRPRIPNVKASPKHVFGGLRAVMSFTNDSIAFLRHIMALAGGSFALLGTTSAARGVQWSVDVSMMPLPLRFVIVMLVAASLGWIFGALIVRLSADKTDARTVLVVIISAVLAGLLIFSVDWLGRSERGVALPEIEIFATLALGCALWIATFLCRQNAARASKQAVITRSLGFLTFSAFSVLILLLTLADNLADKV